MRNKYTYIDTRTGERKYSDKPLVGKHLRLVSEVRGSVPQSVEKRQRITTEDDLALNGPKV